MKKTLQSEHENHRKEVIPQKASRKEKERRAELATIVGMKGTSQDTALNNTYLQRRYGPLGGPEKEVVKEVRAGKMEKAEKVKGKTTKKGNGPANHVAD